MNLSRGQLLPSIPVFIILFCTGPVFAEESIPIETDSPLYHTDEVMVVTGSIPNWKMPVVAMSIFDPEGEILSANNVEIEADGTFTKTVFLDSPFYDKSGTYLVTVEYGKDSGFTTFEIVSEDPEEQAVAPEIIPELMTLDVDNDAYYDGEFVTISGSVSAIGEPTVLVGIYNPDGSPGGFYIADVGSDLKFSASFLAKNGINFKVIGTYSVKAHYAGTSMVTTFDFAGIRQPDPQIEPQVVPSQNSVPEEPEQEPSIVSSNTQQQPQTAPSNMQQHSEQSQVTDTAAETESQKEPSVAPAGNLTVEDEKLGMMLNEIMLNCDSSEFRDSITYYDGMGPALMRLCQYDMAVSYFDKDLIGTPDSVEIYANKGSALAKMGQYDMAVSHYDTALEIAPDFVPALNNKANALMYLGEYDEAISTYNQALEIDPTYTIAYENLERAKAKYVETYEEEKPQATQSDTILAAQELPVEAEPQEISPLEKQKEGSIFDHIGSVFSSIGGIFGFWG